MIMASCALSTMTVRRAVPYDGGQGVDVAVQQLRRHVARFLFFVVTQRGAVLCRMKCRSYCAPELNVRYLP